MVFYLCFVALANTPDTISGKSRGMLPDMWLLGMLLYCIVVILANNQLWQDSNSLNWFHIVLLILSTSSFFFFYWVLNLNQYDPQG